MSRPAAKPTSEPKLVILDERKDLLVGDRILVANDQELLVMFDQLGDILPEQRERRVRDYDVGFLQYLGSSPVVVGGERGKLNHRAGWEAFTSEAG